TNDGIAIDFARVWAGSYQSEAGGPGGALNGASSTLDRWAFSIGGTAAHEAGHTFGLAHWMGVTTLAGEPPLSTHIMPQGCTMTDENRAGARRHFDDTSFSVLASNVGLSVQTIHNWDLFNPNGVTATRLEMDLLSTMPSLLETWAYSDSRSPWINPVVSGP